ncbi:MAG: hypothetical protein WA418_14515 [Bradyrhizobium sp.]
MALIRPKDKAAATSVAVGDIFAIDGTSGVRALDASLVPLTNSANTFTAAQAFGVLSATTVNKVTLTAPAAGSTLTIANGKTLTVSNSLTLAGTDGKTLTVSNSLTLAGTDGTVQTFPSTSGTVVTSVSSNVVTNAMRSQMAAYTLKGNSTGALANEADIDVTTLTLKASPVSGDIVLIQDSAASNAFKKTTVGALSTGGTGWTNVSATAKSTAYPVVSGDNGSSFYLSGNTFFELTYGAPASYASNHANMIYNADTYSGVGTGRGRRINLNGSKFILYPGQNVLIYQINGVWDYHPKNQRWVQGVVSACVDTGGGAIGTVDGLAAGAGAFSQLQDAASFIWYGLDMAGSSATIAPTAGQTFLQTLNLGGQPVGSNVVFLKGNGGQATIQGVNGSDTISVGDNAELIIQDIYVKSSNNTLGKAGLKMHGNGLIDTFSGVTIEGGGANDVGVFIDNGPGIFAQFNTLTFTNTFNSCIWSDRGGNLSIGALITNTGVGTMAVSKIMTLKGVGYTTIGTQITTTNWGGGLGASPVSTGHVLNLNGTTMPGGTSVTSPGVVIP